MSLLELIAPLLHISPRSSACSAGSGIQSRSAWIIFSGKRPGNHIHLGRAGTKIRASSLSYSNVGSNVTVLTRGSS